MSVTLKSQREIDMMRRAGELAAQVLQIGGEAVRPGVTTKHINDVMHKFLKSKNAGAGKKLKKKTSTRLLLFFS